jgi:hypothetical protein
LPQTLADLEQPLLFAINAGSWGANIPRGETAYRHQTLFRVLTFRIFGVSVKSIGAFVVAGVFGRQLFSPAAQQTRSPNMTPNEAIQLHEMTRSKIKSIHIRATSWEEPQKGSDTPRQKGIVTELNRMGIRERKTERFFRMDNSLETVLLGKAEVRMISGGEKELRRLSGWDPENPGALTRYFGIHSHPRGTIDSCAPEWGGEIPLLDLVPYHTLTRLAEIAEFILSPADESPYLRLEVKSTKRPFFAGFKIDLDPAHGYLIRRTLNGHGGLTEVDEFKPYGEGIWIPKRVRSFNPHDGSRITLELDECEVNGPMANKDLIVEFPEGSQVEDREKKKIYLWGKGGPKQAFDTNNEFMRFERAQWVKSLWSRVSRVFGGRGR